MSQKNFAHSKVGSVGSYEMTFFGILKIDPLEPCGNEFQSTGSHRLTVCTSTDSYNTFLPTLGGKKETHFHRVLVDQFLKFQKKSF